MLWIFLAAYFCTWLLIPHVLWLRKRPVSTLAWIWGIILFPFIGALVYLVFGTDRMKRKRLQRRAAFRPGSKAHDAFNEEKAAREIKELSPRERSFLKVLSRLNHLPISVTESTHLLIDASNFYPALLEQIRKAKHHVHIQFYIWRNDEVGAEFLQTLIEAAQRGVQVRVLLDELGSLGLRASYFKPLWEAGGKFSWFLTLNPRRNRYLLNLRNHRKLQVIDGKTAFIGGMNLGREYLGLDKQMGSWRDMQVQLTGAVVNLLQQSFADDWFFATQEKLLEPQYYDGSAEGNELAQVIAGGPDSEDEPMQKSILSLLEHATKRIWLTTGYFAPNEILLNALQICAARGVDVRLLVAQKMENWTLLYVGRSYYEDLLRFGVRIFEYSHGFNHSKVALIDEAWVMVGSANLDNRSMRINFELNLLFHSARHCRELSKILEDDFAESHEIHLKSFKQRSTKKKIVEAIFRPLAPLL